MDSQTYIRTLQKLDVFDPDEILLPISSISPVKSKLCLLIEEHFPGSKIVQTSRKNFNQESERDLILEHAFVSEREALRYELSDKYYMVSAASALLSHIKLKYESSFKLKNLRIKIQASEDSMILNTRTIKSLEVIHNSLNKSTGMSLFKLMNHTKTSMGARILRSNLLQPLTREEAIVRRQDAVEELCKNMDTVKECQEQLNRFEDIDKLLTTVSVNLKKKPGGITDRRINQVIMLKDAVEASASIVEILENVESPLLLEIRGILEGPVVKEVKEQIGEYIHEDTRWAKSAQDLRKQRSNAVRSGKNGFLDVSRQLLQEYTDDIYDISKGYVAEYGVAFDHGYDTKRGHFLKIPTSQDESLEQLPEDVFIHRRRLRKQVECTTLDIMKCNIRIKNVMSEIILLSDQIIDSLLESLAERVFELFMVSEAVAVLDLICSFAQLVSTSTGGYVRPEFTSNLDNHGASGRNNNNSVNKLAIKLSRHPILDRTMRFRSFVPNDIYASSDTSRMNIITGVNMSGKSVYLRQIALLVIMAQTGCL